MFEAYAVGVTLKLNNLISPQLLAISQELVKLDGLVNTIGASLKAIGAESVALKSIAAGASASSTAMDKAVRSTAALERQLVALRSTAASLGGMPALPGGGGGGGGGNRGGFHGGNIHMGPGGIGIGTVGLAAGDAFLPLALTAGGLYAGHAVYEAAKDLDTERARFRLYGLSAAQNNEAFRFVDNMRVMGSSKAENMRLFREAQGVFRESGADDSEALHGAMMAAPVMSRLMFATSALGPEAQGQAQRNMLAAIRYAEMSGGTKSADEFYRIVNFGYKLAETSGGQVDFERLRQFKARAGSAGFNLTEDALARLEPIMGEMTGSTAGVGLRTAYNRVAGLVKIPNQAAHALVENGIWDANRVAFNANGGIKSITGNPLGAANSELLATNPELFYEKVIRPIYVRMKYSQEEITRQNALLFGSTGGALFNLIERQLPTIQKSVAAMQKAAGINEAYVEASKALSGKQQEFEAAWTDFKSSAGTTLLPFFSSLLKGGAAVFRGLSSGGLWDKTTVGMLWNYVSGAGSGDKPAPNVVGVQGQGGGRGGNSAVYLDGRKVGEVVTNFVGRVASGPQLGAGSFDARQHLAPAGGY